MLPSLVARDIEKGLQSYIKNEFPIASDGFIASDGSSVLDRFLSTDGALTKGPWVEMKLPFRRCDATASLPFADLEVGKIIKGFIPYEHQRRAFERLHCKTAQSTIIATGTGSGKTECFLLPILDYCLASDKPGIKAILIYPMNALATDQAKRVADLIKKINETSGKRPLSAGLYTGESPFKPAPDKDESPLTKNREAIRKNPPDILLTNYKMLDFLLLRPEDQCLWTGNGPDTLKYLVVDELHTFDGAQGTDLACLIRRLRQRLGLADSLACVGTSATIVGEDSIQALCSYASEVFAADFPTDAVITENRLSEEEFLPDLLTTKPLGHWPEDDSLVRIAKQSESQAIYFTQAIPLWFDESLGFDGTEITEEARLNLGNALLHLAAFQKLVHDVHGTMELKNLVSQWAKEVEEISNLGLAEENCEKYVEALIDCLIAMASEARIKQDGRLTPLLTIRSQLWIRTLNRAVVSVGHTPEMALANDLPSLTNPLRLPIVGCRECNNAAWAISIPGGIRSGLNIKLSLDNFYQSWFSEHRDTVLLYPVTQKAFYESHRARIFMLCPKCGTVQSMLPFTWEETVSKTNCSCGNTDGVLVWSPDTSERHVVNGTTTYRFKNQCPHCLSDNSLRIFGAGNATLAAAAIDHLNSSVFNEDHKVIAFSDSVQDAALRAGFLSARNYLPACRHGLVHFLNSRPQSKDGIPLKQVISDIAPFWVNQMTKVYTGENKVTLGQAAFLATFMPPDKEWRDAWHAFSTAAEASSAAKVSGKPVVDYSEIIATQPIWEKLFEEVKERLVWEAMLELGFRSENGRTVARTESAVAFPSPEKIEAAARQLGSRLQQGMGIQVRDPRTLNYFITGLINRFRITGAFDVSGFKQLGAETIQNDFGSYIETGNDFRAYNLSRVLPLTGKKYRAPTAVTELPDSKDNFNVSLFSTKGNTWFEVWARKLLTQEVPFVDAQLQDILKITLDVLKSQGLVVDYPRDKNHDTAWVLPIQHWLVSRNVRTWRCSACGRRYFSGDRKTARLWKGMPCLSRGCAGHLENYDTDGSSSLYDAPPVRINAREHTAIIESDTRHKIENNFGSISDRWGVNFLSATPTLEMGIDIGSLSSVLLCSVPPSEASFVQRIGRAGRRDGNALALTLADRSAHDQYYWQDPNAMISGSVTTPGVFLKAVSVLERQLTAFALGLWVQQASNKKELDHLKTAVVSLAAGKEDVFPLAFLSWVSSNVDEIYAKFTQLFRHDREDELTETVRQGLKEFLAGGGERPSMVVRLRSSLENAKRQYEDLQRKRDNLKKLITSLKKKQLDERTENEIESLEGQRQAIIALMGQTYDNKSLFNFLTDEGLLPNYAFPEEGVQVHSIILKRRLKKAKEDSSEGGESTSESKTQERKPRVETFEFSRAAGAALKDLAPSCSFYVNQHILHVDQLNLTADSFEEWRMCSNCSHMERIQRDQPIPTHCPRCGNELFGNVGNVHTLVRTHEITATADAKTDRIDDSKEERRIEPMVHQVFIDVDPDNVEAAWRFNDPKLNFGFEFIKRVTVREINFGSKSDSASNLTFCAAGREFPLTGFSVCKYCGKVKQRAKRAASEIHDANCPCYNKPEDSENSPWVDSFFLYREMESEAIRIRIPVCDMIDYAGADIGTQSLIAAIELGLRRHFHGSVDHLAVTVQTEPVAEASNARNRFIVIYDTIPGGSGYLKDLSRSEQGSTLPDRMMEMFHEAWDAVKNCQCAPDPTKDGCYHCVYHYRDFASRQFISRREAESILQRIATHKTNDIETIRTVSDIAPMDMSVLENLMVKRLSQIPGASFSSRPTKTGEICWELTVPVSSTAKKHWLQRYNVKAGDRFTWVLKAQIDVAGAHPSRPDFLIAPNQETLAAKDPALLSYLFTDGWEFHAPLLTDDTQKRQSLLNQGHRVWSITWQDLTATTDANAPKPDNYGALLPVAANYPTAQRMWTPAFGKSLPKGSADNYVREIQDRLLAPQRSSFDWLVDWLQDPAGFSNDMRTAMEFTAFTLTPSQTPADPQQIIAPLQSAQTEPVMGWFTPPQNLPFVYAATFIKATKDNYAISAAIRINEQDFARDRVVQDEKKHQDWLAFWQTANALQFLARAWICTNENEKDPVYSTCFSPSSIVTPSVSPYATEASAWQEWLDELASDPEFFAHLAPLAQAAVQRRLPAPDDMVDGCNGRIFCDGQALLWTKQSGDKVILIAAEDVLPNSDITSSETVTLVTTNNADWLTQLETALN